MTQEIQGYALKYNSAYQILKKQQSTKTELIIQMKMFKKELVLFLKVVIGKMYLKNIFHRKEIIDIQII